jgi:hypothetical protein
MCPPRPLHVTDILIRGGGGTVTFSDNVTIEYIFKFRPDPNIPAGGVFDITLVGERAALMYETVVSQAVCDMVDWILQCSALNARISIIEAAAGLAKQFAFEAADWAAGIPNRITVIATGTPGAGELGPHELPTGGTYHVSVFKEDGTPVAIGVDTEVEVSLTTGDVTIIKTGISTPFKGRIVISAAVLC